MCGCAEVFRSWKGALEKCSGSVQIHRCKSLKLLSSVISPHRLKGLLIQQQRAIIIELPANKLIKGKFPLSTPAVTKICHTRSSCTIQFVIHHHYADYPNNKLPGLVQSGKFTMQHQKWVLTLSRLKLKPQKKHEQQMMTLHQLFSRMGRWTAEKLWEEMRNKSG